MFCPADPIYALSVNGVLRYSRVHVSSCLKAESSGIAASRCEEEGEVRWMRNLGLTGSDRSDYNDFEFSYLVNY